MREADRTQTTASAPNLQPSKQHCRRALPLLLFIGLSKGETLLPLPPMELPSADRASKDKERVHVLETAVVTWTRQIKNVLKLDPEQVALHVKITGMTPVFPCCDTVRQDRRASHTSPCLPMHVAAVSAAAAVAVAAAERSYVPCWP